MGMWIVAHECGHRAFSDDTTLQDTIGYLFHTALLVPYFSWQRSHAVHHARVNHMSEGESFVPDSVAEGGAPRARDSVSDSGEAKSEWGGEGGALHYTNGAAELRKKGAFTWAGPAGRLVYTAHRVGAHHCTALLLCWFGMLLEAEPSNTMGRSVVCVHASCDAGMHICYVASQHTALLCSDHAALLLARTSLRTFVRCLTVTVLTNA